MKKENALIIIFLILVVALGFFVFSKNEEKPENKVENIANIVENEVENQSVNENIAEENTNTEVKVEENNTTTEPVVQDNIVSSPEKNAYESNSNVGSTNQKQEAINLVRQHWGEDNSVTFTCDSVTSKGEYIIAVISKDTASVKGYFKVNLETKTVEVDY